MSETAEQERKTDCSAMGRRSEETIGSAMVAEVGYLSARVIVYSQVGRGKAAEKPEQKA